MRRSKHSATIRQKYTQLLNNDAQRAAISAEQTGETDYNQLDSTDNVLHQEHAFTTESLAEIKITTKRSLNDDYDYYTSNDAVTDSFDTTVNPEHFESNQDGVDRGLSRSSKPVTSPISSHSNRALIVDVPSADDFSRQPVYHEIYNRPHFSRSNDVRSKMLSSKGRQISIWTPNPSLSERLTASHLSANSESQLYRKKRVSFTHIRRSWFILWSFSLACVSIVLKVFSRLLMLSISRFNVVYFKVYGA